jgi:hypothetical protein
MNRMIVLAAAMSLLADGAHAQSAEPTPTPDAARIWRGTVSYRVTLNGDSVGVDTAVLRVDGAHFVAGDRMHLMGAAITAESRMALPSLAPVASTTTQDVGGQHGEIRLAYAGGRIRGSVAAPGAAPAEVDAEIAVGTYDWPGIAAVLMALPLRTGAVWTIAAYAPIVRAVTPARVEVGPVETVETLLGPVRAFRVRVTGGQTEMLYWFSEAEPRWEVKGEIPAFGITIKVLSRTP